MKPSVAGRRSGTPGAAPAQSLDEEKFLAFRVADKRYLLEILRVKEVVRMQKMTAMPNSPAAIAGVIDLRGSYVPILDMRRQTGAADGPPDPDARIVVTILKGRLAGLLVDELLPVMRIPATEMKPPPRMARDLGYDFLTAMCTRGGEVYMLINCDHLLDRVERGLSAAGAGEAAARTGARDGAVDFE